MEWREMLLVIIDRVFLAYMIMMFVRVLSSWVPELQQYRFMQFIAFYTDPYFNLFRRIIPPLGMIDVSPMIAFLCLVYLIQPFVMWLFWSLLYH